MPAPEDAQGEEEKGPGLQRAKHRPAGRCHSTSSCSKSTVAGISRRPTGPWADVGFSQNPWPLHKLNSVSFSFFQFSILQPIYVLPTPLTTPECRFPLDRVPSSPAPCPPTQHMPAAHRHSIPMSCEGVQVAAALGFPNENKLAAITGGLQG